MKNKKVLYKVICFSLVYVFAISAFGISGYAAAGGNTYYVAKNGSDSWSGSAASPFATISHAASVMKAGDICYIREGTYYESPEISGLNGELSNEISFKAFGDEKVTISGGEEIKSWTKYENSNNYNIYSADMSWDIYEGAGNMLFADGSLCTPARWPNASADGFLDRENYARVSLAGSEDIILKDESFPEADLTGAEIWCAAGVAYWSYLSKVTECDTVNNTITVDSGAMGTKPVDDNIYYLTNHLALVDTPGEWYKDTAAGKLYFYFPEGTEPASMSIEARKREYAISVKNSSHIIFDGINVYGGIVEFAEDTNNITFKNAVVESSDSHMAQGRMKNAKGFVLNGSNNLVTKCEIKNMYGPGIKVSGTENRVINNYIHDINFEHNNGASGIAISGKNHLISRNTVEKTGRSAIGGSFDACVISYNDVSDASRISRDSGTMYFNAHDYKNSEIHHNIIHDSMNNEGLQYALYFDSFTTSMVVYNNLIYNNENDEYNYKRLSLLVSFNNLNNVLVNNTFVNTYDIPYYNCDLSGTVFVNNLFRCESYSASAFKPDEIGVLFKNNLDGSYEEPRDDWNSPENGDYTLKDGAEAIDYGVVVPGINESYVGEAPDCGAFEYGEEPWTAGCDFTKNYSETDGNFALNTKIPFRNLVENRGFEDGLENWTATGDADTFKQHSWEYWGTMTKEGEYSLILRNDGDKVSQNITGLKPFTSYYVGAYGLLGGNYKIAYAFFEALDKDQNKTEAKKVEPVSLSGVGYLGYSLDFGNGSDSLVVGFKNPKSGCKVNVKLGSASGDTIGCIDLSASSNIAKWEWYSVPLDRTLSGTQTIYLSFDGDFSGVSLGGMYSDLTTADDKLVISALSDSGKTKSIEITSDRFDMPMNGFNIITGADGEINLEISKSGTYLNGYVDQITLSEYPDEITGKLSDNLVSEIISVTDDKESKVYGLRKGKASCIKAKIRNVSSDTIKASAFVYTLRDGISTAQSETEAFEIETGGEKEISFDISVPLMDGQTLCLAVFDENSNLWTYTFSEYDFEKQYSGSDKLFIKDFSVRDENGTLISGANAGAFNIFELNFKNISNEDLPVRGILAVYTAGGKLSETVELNRTLNSGKTHTFGLGTVIPSDTEFAKMFIWDGLTELTPYTYSAVFNTASPEE